MTTEWPEASALHACVAWNEQERRRALRDLDDPQLKVPHGAVRPNGNGKQVAMTLDEYRVARQRDAERYHRNIRELKERL
jgi:hypothetical protein